MTYTCSYMKKKYTQKQLESALDEWSSNTQLRYKLVDILSKEGKYNKGYQLQYKGMEMIITGEAYKI